MSESRGIFWTFPRPSEPKGAAPKSNLYKKLRHIPGTQLHARDVAGVEASRPNVTPAHESAA
jgi:hypothetical protein